ncbi:Late embryogenesis abundant protein, partial [Cucurbita argyrosperma subsp. argyrosperma]
MADKDQARPLAPTTHCRPSSDDYQEQLHLKRIQRRRFIKLFCFIIGLLIILSVIVILILMFTLFQVKDPIIQMNKISITKLELINGVIPKPGSNVSLTADVSVKNPNVASFKYSNTTTTLYINETVIGEARGPPGQAKARRTVQMNLTINIVVDRLLLNLNSDMSSGKLRLRSFSRVPGRVKLLHILRRNIVVKMNCTSTINIFNKSIEDQNCKRKVKI